MTVSVFESMAHREHEQVVFCADPASGLRAIIAVHNTALGPSLGGLRMWTFASEEEALRDALRLSRGMTYKAAVAGLNLGGGKAVIIGDPRTQKCEALFRAFGRFVNSLGGRYITAEDVGTSPRDMEWVRMETPYVTGLERALGGSGDPSPHTAWGVFTGIKACAVETFGTDDLSRFRVAIQGLGHTGYYLARYLHEVGARLVVTDIDEDRVRRVVEEFGAQSVSPDDIYGVDAEIFAPAALGGVLNDQTIPVLKCKIVAGAANNQLKEEDRHGPMVRERGILYAPDFVVNAGGLINVANELGDYNADVVKLHIEQIGETLARIFRLSREKGIPTYQAANMLAEQRIHDVSRLGKIWVRDEVLSVGW